MSMLTVPLAEMREIDHPDQLQRVLAVMNLIIKGKQVKPDGKDERNAAQPKRIA